MLWTFRKFTNDFPLFPSVSFKTLCYPAVLMQDTCLISCVTRITCVTRKQPTHLHVYTSTCVLHTSSSMTLKFLQISYTCSLFILFAHDPSDMLLVATLASRDGITCLSSYSTPMSMSGCSCYPLLYIIRLNHIHRTKVNQKFTNWAQTKLQTRMRSQ